MPSASPRTTQRRRDTGAAADRRPLMRDLAALLLLIAAPAWMISPAAQRSQRGWPPIVAETKPWTRWWWQGSAVERLSLTAQLEALAAVGIGGVEVTPIYGVRGTEARFIRYLSPEWMALLDHTLREATRLKLGVDMATGTGWPFGGPWVDDDTTARSIVYKTWTLAAGERLAEPVRLRQAPLVLEFAEPVSRAPRRHVARVRHLGHERSALRDVLVGNQRERAASPGRWQLTQWV